MSKFSKHLEKGIMNSGMTEKQLAKISGFTRSYIALMKNGQRVSPDIEKIEKLILALNLSPEEYHLLWEEYIRARLGDDVYEQHQAVIELLESFNTVSNTAIRTVSKHEIPDVKIVDNHMDLEYLITAVMENESAKNDGFIHMNIQGSNHIVAKVLPALCKNNKNLQVEHIVCMEKYSVGEKENHLLYNVKMLKNLIPVIVFGKGLNYHVYYYYDYVASRFHTGMLLPYMVLTSEYLICMDAHMSRGMITKEPEVRQLYDSMFLEQKKNCRELFQQFTQLKDLAIHIPPDNEIEHVTYSIAQQPCFGVLKTKALVKKYCHQGAERFMPYLEWLLSRNEQWIEKEGNRHIAYCNKEGLRRFMQEGIIDELPPGLHTPLNLEDRRAVIRMLLAKIKEGRYELYLMGENEVTLSKDLYITSYSVWDAMMIYMSEHEQSRIILKENSLTKILHEFSGNLLHNPRVSSLEESVEYLKKLLELPLEAY